VAGLISKRNLFTIPNALSIFGFILVIIGCFLLDSWLGFALVAIGRLADMFDGRLARSLHSESRFGALLDATLDKLALLAIIIAIMYFGMAPLWALAAIVLQNIANAIATALAEQSHPGRDLKPSRIGKYAMVVQNAALALFVMSHLADRPDEVGGILLYIAAVIATVIGALVLGLWATLGYIRRIRHA
jgi:cardiolipin synthase